jgi:hypothetical protein
MRTLEPEELKQVSGAGLLGLAVIIKVDVDLDLCDSHCDSKCDSKC